MHGGGKVTHTLRLYKTAIINPKLSLRSPLNHIVIRHWVTKAVVVYLTQKEIDRHTWHKLWLKAL